MGLTEITILLITAFAYILIVPGRWRGWALLVGSIVGVYWLFPAQNIRWLEYGLATSTLVITIMSWFITRPTGKRARKFTNEDRFVLVMVVLIALGLTFAREVDFFSIGTNDLTQYTLAMDRTNPALSEQADGLNPAVLSLIDRTVKASHSAGKWTGVCGELAANPIAVPILVGLGVDELSCSVPAIPAVKAAS